MIIYKITNLINEKVYIGQTILTLENRINNYIKEYKWAKKDRPIILAMRKYGFENFCFEEIDSAKTKKELDKKERYYISFYNSLCSQNGYNIELGGNSVGKHGEETKRKISEAQIGSLNHMYGKTGSENPTSKPIVDLTTGVIYGAAMEAARELNLNFSHVCAVARGTRGATGGKVFRFINENNEIIQPEHITFIKSKQTKENVLSEYKKYII